VRELCNAPEIECAPNLGLYWLRAPPVLLHIGQGFEEKTRTVNASGIECEVGAGRIQTVE
jgi:hypothetical protein